MSHQFGVQIGWGKSSSPLFTPTVLGSKSVGVNCPPCSRQPIWGPGVCLEPLCSISCGDQMVTNRPDGQKIYQIQSPRGGVHRTCLWIPHPRWHLTKFFWPGARRQGSLWAGALHGPFGQGPCTVGYQADDDCGNTPLALVSGPGIAACASQAET